MRQGAFAETDIWSYALLCDLEIAPLDYAAVRPVVARGRSLIVVDDPARMRFLRATTRRPAPSASARSAAGR